MKLQLHPDAEEELFHEAAWYDAHRVGLGDEFLLHIHRWLDVILEAPHSWPTWPDVPDDVEPAIRKVVVGRFPHVIGYLRSFAGVYVLLLRFAGEFDLQSIREHVARALPNIEALVVALPPPDGPGSGSAEGFGVA